MYIQELDRIPSILCGGGFEDHLPTVLFCVGNDVGKLSNAKNRMLFVCDLSLIFLSRSRIAIRCNVNIRSSLPAGGICVGAAGLFGDVAMCRALANLTDALVRYKTWCGGGSWTRKADLWRHLT